MSDGKEPRRHHFVPKCWLAGFTDTGERDGQLWVTDISRQKQWQTSPANAGLIRDFYRLSDERLDPVLVEKALSSLESNVAPILKSIDRERRRPDVEELDMLLYFMAMQWSRVPAFRPFVLSIFDSLAREMIEKSLKNKESWHSALKKAGIPLGTPGTDYKEMKKSYESGVYTLTALPIGTCSGRSKQLTIYSPRCARDYGKHV